MRLMSLAYVAWNQWQENLCISCSTRPRIHVLTGASGIHGQTAIVGRRKKSKATHPRRPRQPRGSWSGSRDFRGRKFTVRTSCSKLSPTSDFRPRKFSVTRQKLPLGLRGWKRLEWDQQRERRRPGYSDLRVKSRWRTNYLVLSNFIVGLVECTSLWKVCAIN